jgi:hypothetical protein
MAIIHACHCQHNIQRHWAVCRLLLHPALSGRISPQNVYRRLKKYHKMVAGARYCTSCCLLGPLRSPTDRAPLREPSVLRQNAPGLLLCCWRLAGQQAAVSVAAAAQPTRRAACCGSQAQTLKTSCKSCGCGIQHPILTSSRARHPTSLRHSTAISRQALQRHGPQSPARHAPCTMQLPGARCTTTTTTPSPKAGSGTAPPPSLPPARLARPTAASTVATRRARAGGVHAPLARPWLAPRLLLLLLLPACPVTPAAPACRHAAAAWAACSAWPRAC